MRPGVPWNIKDISPEAREAAQIAARRAGLSLGDWLAQAISAESRNVAAFESAAAQPQYAQAGQGRMPQPQYRAEAPVPQQGHYPAAAPQAQQNPSQLAAQWPQQAPQHTALAPAHELYPQRNVYSEQTHALNTQIRNSEFAVVAHGLRDLADRLEGSERRQQQEISQINQTVAAMSSKVETADRIKEMAETAFATATDAINQSAREQAEAFGGVEGTVRAIGERLALVETKGALDPIARDTVSRLESALDGLKSRLTDAERRGHEAQSSLDTWVKNLTGRIDESKRETSDLILTSTQGLARAEAVSGLEVGLTQVRTDLAENERRQREKAQALATIQNGLNAIRAEIAEADRRSREAVSGLEGWIKNLAGRVDAVDLSQADFVSRWSDDARAFADVGHVRELRDGLTSLRDELRSLSEGAIGGGAARERASKEAQATLEASIRKLAEQVSQAESVSNSVAKSVGLNAQSLSDRIANVDVANQRLAKMVEEQDRLAAARAENLNADLQESLQAFEARIDRSLSAARQNGNDAALDALKQSVEQLSATLAKSETANGQTAQRQAAAIRKVEDMIQGFARGLDSVGDVAKGPLAAPISAVQTTLETITGKIEDSDKRAANAIGTIESALKAFSSRIDESERKQSFSSGQMESSLKSLTQRLDRADRQQEDRAQKFDASIQAVNRGVESAEHNAKNAYNALDANVQNIAQRLDTAERRNKEAVAGLRMTVDGLVAKVAAEPHAQRTAPASFSPSPLSSSAPPLPRKFLTEAPLPELPPRTESSSILGILAKSPATPPATLPTLAPRVLDASPPSLPQRTETKIPPPPELPQLPPYQPALAKELSPPALPPAPLTVSAVSSLLAKDEKSLPPSFDELLFKPDGQPLPQDGDPLPPPAKKADDFLAQARRAAQAAAAADAASAPLTKKSVFGQTRDAYDSGGSRNIGRLAIVALAFVGLVAGVIALVTTFPDSNGPDDPNRPAPGASLSEIVTGDAQSPVTPAFTELPPAPPSETAIAPTGVDPLVQPEGAVTSDGETLTPLGPTPLAENKFAEIEAAANRGDARGQFLMGVRAAEGRGVEKNPATAIEWFQKSANAGFSPAQYRMGAMYERGSDGLPKDLAQAREWYEKAASSGNRKAMHNLAVLFAEGTGVAQSFETAAKWFREGAEHGLTDSQFNLGVLYERGMGVEKNALEAAKWYAIAAAQGDGDAATKLEAIRKTMSPSQIAGALEEARNFKPKASSATANETPAAPG
jgi:localization factor PodJL